MTSTAAKARRRREQSAFLTTGTQHQNREQPELEARNLTYELDDAGAGRLNAVLGCDSVTELTCFDGPSRNAPFAPFHGPEGWTGDTSCVVPALAHSESSFDSVRLTQK
jgi:hypothetical protein